MSLNTTIPKGEPVVWYSWKAWRFAWANKVAPQIIDGDGTWKRVLGKLHFLTKRISHA